MRFIHLIPLLILLGSCTNSSQEDKYAEIVSQWQGREIKLPAVMTDFLTGDTINLDDADFTILTYVDSAGCTGCKMKLPIWDGIIQNLESNTEATVNVVMVINPKQSADISSLFRQDLKRHPIAYVDSSGYIGHNNKFPTDMMFQSVLLDMERRVLTIGNPAYNSGIHALYAAIVSGGKTLSLKTDALVNVNPRVLNIEKLHCGDSLVRDVTLSNDGTDTVFIDKIIESCECVTTSASLKFIPPHADLSFPVTIKGDSSTAQYDRSINIYYRDFDYPSVILISENKESTTKVD
ncbi:MAG: DUF1573 domain-containing protein [Lachnospiraceae bacterium]|nr:DUF1573 domain-containing protein [Lachnospiraceae bacterium]